MVNHPGASISAELLGDSVVDGFMDALEDAWSELGCVARVDLFDSGKGQLGLFVRVRCGC